MGRSSSGSFDVGVTSAYSSSGRAEPFGSDVSDQPRRSYDNLHRRRSYSNNQGSWSDEQDQWGSSRRRSWSTGQYQGTEASYGFFAVLAFFTVFRKLYSSLRKVNQVLIWFLTIFHYKIDNEI